LCRARKLPVGSARNDLRQLAIGLRWLEKNGFAAKVHGHFEALTDLKDGRTSLE
jgi:hypothetical protein